MVPVFEKTQTRWVLHARELRHEAAALNAGMADATFFWSRRSSLERFIHGWGLWAVIAVIAVALVALIGWGLVWMLALSD